MDGVRQHIAVDEAAPIEMFGFNSGQPGPVLAVLGGVHGDEPEGVFAARKLARSMLDVRRGQLIVVPIAHPAAFDADTRESPDGGNLARVFPGRADGTAVERTAAALTRSVLSQADMLVDLHTAGRHYDMPFMTGYIDTADEAGARSRRMADIFGADIVWRHRTCAPGRSLSVMADAGKPAIYTEAAGGGTLDPGMVDRYVAGIRRVMAAFDMIAGDPGSASAARHVEGDGNLDKAVLVAPSDGFFSADVVAGQSVAAEQALGRLLTLDGEATPVLAPHDGVVMFVRRTARVATGTPLVALAAEDRETAA